MGLNAGQQVAVDGILDTMYETDEPGAALIGEGGTGKTYSCTAILHPLVKDGYNVLMAAPTNKAVKQLEKACRAAQLPMDDINFRTIHSALGLGLMPSAEKKYVARIGDSIIPDVDVIVLDEMSMMNSICLDNYYLPDIAAAPNPPFSLMMGDDMQLPPVKETTSPAFELYRSWELTVNERQKNNPDGTPNSINVQARQLRNAIKAERPWTFDAPSDQNIAAVKDIHFLGLILEHFTLDRDLEESRVIAWSNARVDQINNAIRRKLFGDNPDRYIVGERIVTGGPITAGDKVLLTTDEECFVSAINEGYVVDEETGDRWNTWRLTLRPIYADVVQVHAHVLHDSEQERYKAREKALKDKAMNAKGTPASGLFWRKYYQFVELFSDIRYCYAITAHRAQGSSYTFAFLDVKNMLECPRKVEARKLIYVGWSRARSHLTINKTGFKV